MKLQRLTSAVLILCLVFSVFTFATVENASLKAGAAVGVSVNGSTLASANFIIDPGHGGNDPGAMSTVLGGSRKEADDTLRLSLAVAKLVNQSGASAALTRVTDITLSLQNRTDMANAGSYSYFISIHRNACGTANLGTGIETYYHQSQSATSPSAKFATSVQNELIAVGCWKNRGVKYNNFHVTRESNMPAILVECSFIDNATDNANFDKYFDADAKAIANGMLKMIGKSVVDNKNVTAPSVTVNSSVNYNTAVNVSWGKVTNATSYAYTAKLYNGEPSATSAASTIVSSTTTGTSFTIPAQSKGKYIEVTVTAKGASNEASTKKLIMLGTSASYPTTVEYIPVADINGGVNVSNSTIWTSAKGTNFAMTWWRAFLCSPNSDGTYTVNNVYENGATKSVAVSGKNILFAIHSSYTNYALAEKIVVGDKLTLVGVYMDSAKVLANAHILVNGGVSLSVTAPTVSCPSEIEVGDTGNVSWAAVANAKSYNYKVVLNNNGATSTLVEKTGVTDKSFTIPAVKEGTSLTVTVTAVGPVDSKTTTKTITLKVTAPTDITSSKANVVKVGDSTAFRGFAVLSTVEETLASFEQDNSFLVIYDANGVEKSASDIIATGYTVNLVVNGSVKVSYALVVAGDIDGDGAIAAADYISQAKAMKAQVTLDGAFALAADVDGDGTIASSDYIALAAALKN